MSAEPTPYLSQADEALCRALAISAAEQPTVGEEPLSAKGLAVLGRLETALEVA